MLDRWHDGHIKQYVLSRLLKDRAQSPDLYANGDYQPLPVLGSQCRRLIAFARDNHRDRLVVVVPRLWNGLSAREALPLDRSVWGDTRVALPKGSWQELLSGAEITVDTDEMAVGDFLGDLPFAVLKRVALS
jgi:(1->4)-alpha-D-glucan 1-alpha-D-glucosylmutase